jgi:glycosyltransferase involved in cell wall biosynthesis
LGSVLLAKGIPYLMEAARKLEEAPIRFSIVGPIHITEQAVASAPSNVTFVGRVSRDETADWYRRADVFVLPTLSDGFAITQIEAMSHGLPVIATPNCGRVVTEGEDGFLVPPRDVDALVDALATFIDTPSRIGAMSKRALETSQTFTLDRVASRLIDIARAYA